MEQLQNHKWLTASSYMGKNLRISSYIRKPFLIYDFAAAPFWISLYMKKILLSFLSVYPVVLCTCPVCFPHSPPPPLLTSSCWQIVSSCFLYFYSGLERETGSMINISISSNREKMRTYFSNHTKPAQRLGQVTLLQGWIIATAIQYVFCVWRTTHTLSKIWNFHY